METDIKSVIHDEDGTAAENSKLETWLDTEATAPRSPTVEAESEFPKIESKVDTITTVQTKNHDITITGAKSTTMDEVMSSAIAEGNEKRTRELFEHKYDIECKDKDGHTPLLLATRHRRDALVRMLLEQGAKPGGRSNEGATILHMLASSSETPISETLVDLVLRFRPPLDASDNQGSTPLMFACANGENLLVTKFIHHGADVRAVDQASFTPLHYLAAYKQPKATPSVVANSALIDATTIESKAKSTSLHEAAGTSSGISSIFKELLLAGADKEARAGSLEHTPLLSAVRKSNEAYVACLLESGVDINASERFGLSRTSLHIAAADGQLEIVKAFLDHGANPTIQDKEGRTALHIAAADGQLEIIKALLDHGANPTIRDFGVFLGNRASAVSMRSDVSPTQKKAVRTLLKEAEKAWKKSHRK